MSLLMKTAGTLLVISIALVGAPGLAQSQGSGSNSDTSKTTAADKAPATATPDKKPDPAQKPKKVWTNDDVGSLKSSVSVVGGKNQPRSQAEEQGRCE